MAATAGPAGVQQVLIEVQSALQATCEKQLVLLGEARAQHSHSDLLLPPDLASNILAPSCSDLKRHVHSVIEAAYPPQVLGEAQASGSDGNHDGLSRDGAALHDVIRLDVVSLLARKLVFADLLDKIRTTDALDNNEAKALYDRLDVILALEVCGLAENSLALTMHHEVLERLSVSACRQHFDYIESRVGDLTQGLLPSKGKGLVLLRMCNELLRRLSKPSSGHTIFAGRILTFLSGVFPLGERSGVNLRGDFNVDNKTFIEPAQLDDNDQEDSTEDESASDKASLEIDSSQSKSKEAVAELRKRQDEAMLKFAKTRAFYEIFWGTQQYFSNPSVLVHEKNASTSDIPISDDFVDPAPEGSKGRMQTFRRATRRIFDIFGAVQRRERELAGQIAAEEGKAGAQSTKRAFNLRDAGEDVASAKRFKGDPGEDEITPDEATTSDSFFPKYLTGSNLLEYELRDASFRRHVLVQYLILFQYLLSFTNANREKAKTWKNAALAHSMSYALDESDDRWLREIWRETLNHIRDTSTEGRNYALSVLQILRHEARWISWKTESCPPIDKLPLSDAQIKAFLDARKVVNRPLRPYPFPLGTAALSRLWEDGVRPPEPSTRTMEDETGMEVQVQTDGLDELEMGPQIPSLESYASEISKIEKKQAARREALGWSQPRPYVVATHMPAAVRQSERERIVREGNDEEMAAMEQRRNVLSWRALRLARTSHLDLFAKIQAEYTTSTGGEGVAVGMRIDDITGLMASVEKQEKGIPIVAVAPPPPPTQEIAPSANADDDTKEKKETANKEESELVPTSTQATEGESSDSKTDAASESLRAPIEAVDDVAGTTVKEAEPAQGGEEEAKEVTEKAAVAKGKAEGEISAQPAQDAAETQEEAPQDVAMADA